MQRLPVDHGVLCTVVALTLAVVGCGAAPAQAGSRQAALTNPAPPARATAQTAPAVKISQEEFERLLHEGHVVLIDVRSYRAYLQAHLPDAVSIPLEKLKGSLARLRAANARIVLYCGGDAAVKSSRAAAVLREHGFEQVYCLDGGFEQWVASGRVVIVQPTET